MEQGSIGDLVNLPGDGQEAIKTNVVLHLPKMDLTIKGFLSLLGQFDFRDAPPNYQEVRIFWTMNKIPNSLFSRR